MRSRIASIRANSLIVSLDVDVDRFNNSILLLPEAATLPSHLLQHGVSDVVISNGGTESFHLHDHKKESLPAFSAQAEKKHDALVVWASCERCLFRPSSFLSWPLWQISCYSGESKDGLRPSVRLRDRNVVPGFHLLCVHLQIELLAVFVNLDIRRVQI